MTATTIPTGRIKLENVRLSFPALFKPEAFKPGDKPKFKATFLIPQGSPLAKQVDAKILAVLKEKFPTPPGKAQQILSSIQGNTNKFCWQNGDHKSYDGYAGMMALSCKSDVKPSTLAGDKSEVTEESGILYAGCYVNASVDLFVYNQQGVGMSCQVRGVQFLRKGDAFAAGRPADADEFDEVTEGADAGDFGTDLA